MVKKPAALVWVFLAAVLFAAAGYFSFRHYKEEERKRILLEERKACWNVLRQTVSAEVSRFKGDAGVLIKDLDMNWEIEFNPDKLYPSASISKVPIMASCFYAELQGRIRMDELLTLKSSDKVMGSGRLKDSPGGSRLRVDELVERMITESDNTAANMLIDLLGRDYLNVCFKELGLKNTTLARKMMDFKSRALGLENYTTVEDIAYITEKIYRGELFNPRVSGQCLELLKRQKVRDRIPARLPEGVITAHKTGLERYVCHDAGVVFTPKGNFLVCVLTRHADKTSRRAKEFIASLALDAYDYYQEI